MKFDHVSIAVRSIDRALDFFAKYFPITPRNPRIYEEQVSGGFFWQDFHLGGFTIELIEDPAGKPGFVSRFIDRRGEGMHHLSLEVDELAPLVERLKRDGVRVVDEQRFPDGGATAFISPRSAFGALIQFWEVADHAGHDHKTPPPCGLSHFDHVSLAVRDIRSAMDFFARYFPTGEVRKPHLSSSSGNFVLAHMDVAGFKLEFLQSPGEGARRDFVADFIRRRGEGLHHISIDLKEFDSTLERLKRDNVRVVDESTNWRGERQFFISPRSAFGVLIQIWDGM
jgi:catechol 2,3-dioxygenase-like lactoylglutathione lyase family enzyme